MSLFWALYFIDVATSISIASVFLFITTMVLNIVCLFAKRDDYIRYGNKRAFFIHLLVLIFSLALLTVSIAIPGKKTMYSMLAVKCAERLRLGEEIPKKVMMVIDKKLDSYLK